MSLYNPPASCQIPGLAEIYEKHFGMRTVGTFVEVGAFDGESYSNTSFLADMGWTGIYVEPVEEYARKCGARHTHNKVMVVAAAAGSRPGTVKLDVAGALTTGKKETADAHRANPGSRGYISEHSGEPVYASMRTLDWLIGFAGGIGPGFDLLVVDVEGMEPEVFSGFSLDMWRPKMMIVELHQDNVEFAATAKASEELRRHIMSNGYREEYVDQINTIFLRNQ